VCENGNSRFLRRTRDELGVRNGQTYFANAGGGHAYFDKKEAPKILGPDGNPIEKDPVPFGFHGEGS
jgi:hypothetical protein